MKLPRHAEIWLAPYLRDRLRKIAHPANPKRAWVAITDHFEPLGGGRIPANSAWPCRAMARQMAAHS